MGGTPVATEWHWLWDAYFVGVCGVAAFAVFLLNDLFPGQPPPAAALLVAMAAWAVVAGRHVPRSGELNGRAVVFVAVTLTLFVAALLFSRIAIAAIPAVYPVVFSALPLTTAIVVTTVFNLIPLALLLTVHGPRDPDITVAVALTLLGMIMAPVIGTMVVTASRQRTRLATLVTELEATRAETARLSREAGISGERERLAREIHDTLAQGFTSIVALAQAVQAEVDTDPDAAARHLELIRTTARDNLTEARVMVAGLTPAALHETSLAAAIRRQCDALVAETGVEATMTADDDLPQLPMATEVVLLRAAQEALTNVRRHSQARAVRVRLSAGPDTVRLSLSDNGIGLNGDHAEGFGLRGMRARAAHIGGTMTTSPTPGGGLTVTVEVPR